MGMNRITTCEFLKTGMHYRNLRRFANEFFVVCDKTYRAIENVRVPTIHGNIAEEIKENLSK